MKLDFGSERSPDVQPAGLARSDWFFLEHQLSFVTCNHMWPHPSFLLHDWMQSPHIGPLIGPLVYLGADDWTPLERGPSLVQ